MDKADQADASYDIMFDGVLLNATALRREYGQQDMASLLARMWEACGEKMLTRLKGSFVLSLWDKANNRVLVTGDRLNKRPLYYHFADDRVYFSSRYLDLVALLAENGICPVYSDAAFAMLSTGGQLFDKFTPLRDVFCLRPYEYLLCENGESRLIDAEPTAQEATASRKELLERFDELFSQAVRLQYEKNSECGYEQMASLSGGMDTRSVALMGKRLGYPLHRSFCYCQSGAADEKIARQLARELNAPMDFLPLDGGAFLHRAEDHGRRNECIISFCGATGALSMAETLPLESAGIIHSGIFGGELMASIFRADDGEKPRGRFSGKAHEEFHAALAPTQTESKLRLHMLMRGCLNFVRMFEFRAEAISPFMDEDVYEFMLTVPFDMRKARMFYARWMRKKIPNPYVTTYYKLPMNAPEILLWFVPRFLDRVPIRFRGYDMHPMQQWYDQQPELRRSIREQSEKYGENTLPTQWRHQLLDQCASDNVTQAVLGLNCMLAAWLTDEARENI